MTYTSNALLSNDDRSLLTFVPERQLLDNSLHIAAPDKPFHEWTQDNHADSYRFMQRIAQAWKEGGFTDQYFIYGKFDLNPFHWEMIPYQKCATIIKRIVQQLKVLWRVVFGGVSISEETANNQFKMHESLLSQLPETTEAIDEHTIGDDPFCNQDRVERQRIITGDKVNVLFNQAPIGFGGERLHFLIVPKKHRETFTDVTEQEYCESMALTANLINHFMQTRESINSVYLFNKTGKDAGVTVKHWHIHVIFCTERQGFWGKLTVIKNILFGSSPMKEDALVKKVGELRRELGTEI